MTIRREQYAELRSLSHGRWVDRLMAHFAQTWPEQVTRMGKGYRDWIEQGVQAATAFGIDTQELAARFINLWFVWGRDFERRPGFGWALEILNDAGRSAFVKIHQLSYRTRLELEARVEEQREAVLI